MFRVYFDCVGEGYIDLDAETEEEARELFEMYDRDCEILSLSEGTLQIGNFEVDEVEELPEEN